MSKNLVSRPILIPLAQIWAPKFFFLLGFVSARCYTLLQAIKTKQKNLVLGPILAHFAQIWAANFFPQKFGFVSD